MPAIPTEPGAEWSVLLAACSTLPGDQKLLRLRSAIASSVPWHNLFVLAEQHGAQPLLYHALQPVRDTIPAEEMHELERNYRANLSKVLLLSRELIQIVHHLGDQDLEVIPYKGPALAEFLYRDIALRQAGDIDLLVRRGALSRIQEALAQLGYSPQMRFSGRQQSEHLKSGYECVFDGPAGRNVLEVQWSIEPRFYSVDFDMKGIFDRSLDIAVAGQSMKGPSACDLFLILAVHAAKHVWARLIWTCDLAKLISHPSVDWGWIASQAKDLGILRIVKISMALANQLLGTEIPAGVPNLLRAEDSDLQLVAAVQQQMFTNSHFSVESFSYFRLMMRLRERSSDRLHFLSRLVFTPGPSEWDTVRLPSALFPLYRVVRLSRLLARVLAA